MSSPVQQLPSNTGTSIVDVQQNDSKMKWKQIKKSWFLHSKITMAGNVVPYSTVTALVPTLK